eukprot:4803668-Karenia_brevis.AAC.1
MDQSFVHRVPEPGIGPEPVEYAIGCCPRCETPLCCELPAPGNQVPGCSACGLVDPTPLAKPLTVQSGHMYHVENLIIDAPQQMQPDAESSDAPQVEEVPEEDQGLADAPS